jgi:lysophospholipase L1-like esterase
VAGTVVGLTTGGEPSAAASAPASAPASAGIVAEETPSVTFVGDSWTVGEGATDERGYAVRTGEVLGWDYAVLGVGGSGYTRPGGGTTFGMRIDRAVATGADVVVVQGSLNERASQPDLLEAAALATLARLSSEVDPGTIVLVVGASYSPGTPDPTIDWINEAIGAAADRVGLPFVNPAEEDWTDPADETLWADPDHPNDAGYQLIADRLALHLAALLAG